MEITKRTIFLPPAKRTCVCACVCVLNDSPAEAEVAVVENERRNSLPAVEPLVTTTQTSSVTSSSTVEVIAF